FRRQFPDSIQPLRVQLEEILNKDMHVVVDLKRRRLAVRRGAEFISLHPCAVGKGGMLVDKNSGRTWEFQTPRGVFAIRSRVANPVWFR
ncbi:MAG: L,D-transpeptidase, partial [bacterium]